jgi:hypothetical protein
MLSQGCQENEEKIKKGPAIVLAGLVRKKLKQVLTQRMWQQ